MKLGQGYNLSRQFREKGPLLLCHRWGAKYVQVTVWTYNVQELIEILDRRNGHLQMLSTEAMKFINADFSKITFLFKKKNKHKTLIIN